jgi:hypothetical protein
MRFAKTFVTGAVIALTSVSCGSVVRQGRSPVYLVIDLLAAARGGGSAVFGNPLYSDVITNVTSPPPCSPTNLCPTIFSDLGQVTLRIVLKDLGPENNLLPSPHNAVTMTRYRVDYRRADGRNTPGVDVPYGFDGAMTGTVTQNGAVVLPFELVRHAAKMESPLVQLMDNPNIITTITTLTFYGRDQAGNEVTVSGDLQVDFGNFGDQ